MIPNTAKSLYPFDAFIRKTIRQLVKIDFRRKSPLVLVNGVAEQYESWFFNIGPLTEEFVVHCPNLYLFQSDSYLNELPNVSVNWVADKLKTYLDSFAQTPPYHFVGSSSGCQAIVTLAAMHPEMVSKIVLICPSGLGGEENLPVIDGVTKRDLKSMIAAIFYDRRNFVIDEIVQILKERFDNKKWRLGFVRMAQVTKRNSILSQLLQLKCPILFICGEEDQIIPIWQAYRAAKEMRDHGLDVRMLVISKCGHAPQIERSQITNKYMAAFLHGKLFGQKPKERFWRLDNGLSSPFNLDDATSRAMNVSKKSKHILEKLVAA